MPDELPGFSLDVTVRVSVTPTLERGDNGLRVNFRCEIDSIENQSGHAEAYVSLLDGVPFFEREQFVKWVGGAYGAWLEAMPYALGHEALLHLVDHLNAHLGKVGVKNIEPKEIVKEHLESTRVRLVELLEATLKGRPAQWSAVGLSAAVVHALRSLPPRSQNYEGVAALLRERFGEQAPRSGGALRQQVSRLNLDWKVLKSEAKKGRKLRLVSYR
jgi:hypothetical protein